MAEIALTGFYLLCCFFAYRAGHRKHWIVIALILALSFQYWLEFSLFAQIVVAVIFGLYFLLPNLHLPTIPQRQKPIKSQPPSNPTTPAGTKKPQASNTSGRTVQSVYREFMNITAGSTTQTAQASPPPKTQAAPKPKQPTQPQLGAPSAQPRSKTKTKTDNRTPEETLGLSAGFTLRELKEARKREVMRWNPTNIVNKPQALKDEAEEEMQKILEAYDALIKRFP